MYKKIIAITMATMLAASVPVFADTQTPAAATDSQTVTTTSAVTADTQTTTAAPAATADSQTTTTAPEAATTSTTTATEAPAATTDSQATATVEAGVTPDSPLYILDKLVEKIQIAMISDSVKEAEALAKLAQERLAESKAMLEAQKIDLGKKALGEYEDLMEKAVTVVDTAVKEGKTVSKIVDTIAKYSIEDEEIINSVVQKVPEQYREELKQAIANLPEKDASKPAEEEKIEVVTAASYILKDNVTDKALMEKIEKAGLNNRQLVVLVSLSEQSGKPLAEILDMFLANGKGIGSTAIELKLAPKDALKGINKTFKSAKAEIKEVLKEKADLEKLAEEIGEKDEDAAESNEAAVVSDNDNNKDDDKDVKVADGKAAKKIEKSIEKAQEKLEKQIEKSEKKNEKALEKKIEKATHQNNKGDRDNDRDDDHDDDNDEGDED